LALDHYEILDQNSLSDEAVTERRSLQGRVGGPAEEAWAAEKKAEELKEKQKDAEARVKDIKTTMLVLIGVIGILTAIGICCFLFAIPECSNKEPDSDEEEEEDYGAEEDEGEDGEDNQETEIP